MSIDEWRALIKTGWTIAFWIWLAVFCYMCIRLALSAVRNSKSKPSPDA